MAKDKIVEFGDGRMMEYQQVGRRSELVGVGRLGEDLSGLKMLDAIAFNAEAERFFVDLLERMLEKAGEIGVSVRDARAETSFRLGISPETARRYIEKFCAPSAPYEIIGGRIRRKKEGKEDGNGK